MSTLRTFCSSAFGTAESVCSIVTDTVGTLSSGLIYVNREASEMMRQQSKRIECNKEVADKEITLAAAEREASLSKRIARLDAKLIKKYGL